MKINSRAPSPRQQVKPSETASRLRRQRLGTLPQFIRNNVIRLQILRLKLAETKPGTVAERALLFRIRQITTKLKSHGYKTDSITVSSEGSGQDHRKPALNQLSAREKALERGKVIAEEDLHLSGGAYDLDKVCRVLHGVSKETIDHRVRDGSLLAIPGPGDTLQFPVVQFLSDGSVVSGLKAVQEALPTKNRSVILNFLIHPDQRLGDRKPIDLLKSGEIETVVEAARRAGEQGA